MLKSDIKNLNGKPTLFIDEKPTTAMAYTTYFEERNCYEDFIQAGYRIFFVNISMTLSPINSLTGFTPFRVGVFENPNSPDYSEFEEAVKTILKKCPEAIIFPRIYVSMPKWWLDSHPDEVVETQNGGKREIMFSDVFRKDAAEFIVTIVRHIKNSEYASRIAGWQLCGGQTQEWFHHNLCGSLCNSAAEPYRRWVEENYGEKNAALPTVEEFQFSGEDEQKSENAKRYSYFCNLGVAKSLEFFAKTVKEETDRKQVVGAFYGYSFESCGTVLFGSHALRYLLASGEIDFFSSPNAYANSRGFGIDWADMMPVDSIVHHGKLCFIECDIRTYLTISIQEARPGVYPDDMYKVDGESVWVGPPTPELSRQALRKSFAHQISKRSAIWWFDMWGGWYDDPLLMDEVIKMKQICDKELGKEKAKLSPEIVFFADETGYANMFNNAPQLHGIIGTRTAMGNIGAPYDSVMVEDAEAVLKNYKAAVFPMPIPSEAGKKAMQLCEKLGIPYISATPEHYVLTVDKLCSFITKSDVHIYSEEKDVVYAGNGYVGLHTATGGVKNIKLPQPYCVTSVFGTKAFSQITDTIQFELNENETALFSIDAVVC